MNLYHIVEYCLTQLPTYLCAYLTRHLTDIKGNVLNLKLSPVEFVEESSGSMKYVLQRIAKLSIIRQVDE